MHLAGPACRMLAAYSFATRMLPRADGMCLLVRCALQLAADKGVTLKEWAAAVLAPVEGHQVGT